MKNIQVTPVKIIEYPVPFVGGVAYYSGWGVARADGSIYSTDGRAPVCWKYKRVASEVAAAGLIPGAQFVKPA
jgi:hypothetical protein